MMDKIANVAGSVADGLKAQPLALALVVINVLFLAMLVWIIHEVREGRHLDRQEQAKIIQQLIECKRG